jgi:hypothetical protein
MYMCDAYTPLLSSVLFWTLSLIPGNIFRYVWLAAAGSSLLIYAVHYNLPSTRYGRLTTAIATATDILVFAKPRCLRDHLDLAETERHLFQ